MSTANPTPQDPVPRELLEEAVLRAAVRVRRDMHSMWEECCICGASSHYGNLDPKEHKAGCVYMQVLRSRAAAEEEKT